MKRGFVLGLVAFSVSAISRPAGLKPETLKAWHDYVQSVDARAGQWTGGASPFLWSDQDPLRSAQVHHGEILAAPEVGSSGFKAVPNGLIHQWVAAAFIPGVTLAKVFAVTHAYGRYPEIYKGVVDAALVSRIGQEGSSGEEEQFRIRYARKVLFKSEVLDSEYKTRYVQLDAHRWYSITESVRLREVPPDGEKSKTDTTAEGSRYIWRTYSVSRYEQRDGGVYMEVESSVLSRTIPFALRWLVEPAVRELSRELMVSSLRMTRDAVCSTVGQVPDLPISQALIDLSPRTAAISTE